MPKRTLSKNALSKIAAYAVPVLLCGLFVFYGLLKGREASSADTAAVSESALTAIGVENCLKLYGYEWEEGRLYYANAPAGELSVTGEPVTAMTLTLPYDKEAYGEESESRIEGALLLEQQEQQSRCREALQALCSALSLGSGSDPWEKAEEKLDVLFQKGRAQSFTAGGWHFSFSIEEGSFLALIEKK